MPINKSRKIYNKLLKGYLFFFIYVLGCVSWKKIKE